MATDALRKFRDDTGTTLNAIAQKLGVHKSTVLRWEEGEIPAERVLPLEKLTGVPRHELRPDIYPRRDRVSA